MRRSRTHIVHTKPYKGNGSSDTGGKRGGSPYCGQKGEAAQLLPTRLRVRREPFGFRHDGNVQTAVRAHCHGACRTIGNRSRLRYLSQAASKKGNLPFDSLSRMCCCRLTPSATKSNSGHGRSVRRCQPTLCFRLWTMHMTLARSPCLQVVKILAQETSCRQLQPSATYWLPMNTSPNQPLCSCHY